MTGEKARLPAAFLGFLMAAVALAACTETPSPVNKAPVARIGSPPNGATFDTGVVITFDGNGSYDPEKKALTYRWNFGDNTTATGNLTTHSYALPGKYIVGLEVSDGKKTGSYRVEVNIKQANRAPAVKFKSSGTTVSNEEQVLFNASETTDADGDALTFGWSFGDGGTAQGMTATHLFAAVGAFNVTLSVSDGKTTSGAQLAIMVYQANRPPVPVLRAVPEVAFIHDPVELDAHGSHDADNDTLSASWSFGDGSNGTGMEVTHAYAGPGKFTVTGTVGDGKASRTDTLVVTVLPRARILLDWNGTDYGYMILPEAAVNGSALNVGVTSSAGGTDPSAALEILAADSYRATSTVLPTRGAVLTVTASYLGHDIASRTLTIYEGTALPGKDCTATVESTVSGHSQMPDGEEWMNLSAAGDITVVGWHADYELRIVNGTMENINDAGENEVRAGRSEIYQGWFNQTFDQGVPGNRSYEIYGRGNSTTTNTTSSEVTERLSVEMVWKVFEGNTTYLYQQMEGTQMGLNIVMKVDTLGIEEKANGHGTIFPCIKTHTNMTGDGRLGMLHLRIFRDLTSWTVQSGRYVNSTIYVIYAINVYTVDDATGIWTLWAEQSSSGEEYPDDDGDGTYNPDPAPVSMDEAYEFHGLVPRELRVGDRIAGTNQHGMIVVMEVTEESTMGVDVTVYDVVRVQSTFEHDGGNGSGSSDAWVVSSGNLTGLPLKTEDVRSWTNDLKTESTTSEMTVTGVREG